MLPQGGSYGTRMGDSQGGHRVLPGGRCDCGYRWDRSGELVDGHTVGLICGYGRGSQATRRGVAGDSRAVVVIVVTALNGRAIWWTGTLSGLLTDMGGSCVWVDKRPVKRADGRTGTWTHRPSDGPAGLSGGRAGGRATV